LEPGDRLVQGGCVVDALADVLTVRGPPDQAVLVFFRRRAGPLKFLSPWLGVPGVRLPGFIKLDVMHILDLGVTARFLGTALRRLLHAGRWGSRHARSEDQRVSAMLGKIRAYYAERRQATGGRRLTEISRTFPGKLLGPEHKPFFKGKAKECRDLLDFAVQELRVPAPGLPGQGPLLEAGEALQAFYAAVRAHPGRLLPPADRGRLLVASLRFLSLWRQAKGHTTIKHHYFVHLCEQAVVSGNPRVYSTYPDESLNRVIKRMAQATRSARFARRVLCRARVTLEG
jgi:hypothetical protein